MATANFYNGLISANMGRTVIWGGPGNGGGPPNPVALLIDFGISMKTVTAGLGNLLATLEYTDASGTPQTLNVSELLTAGNALSNVWPGLWWDVNHDLALTFSYLGGIVSGTCQVDIMIRQ